MRTATVLFALFPLVAVTERDRSPAAGRVTDPARTAATVIGTVYDSVSRKPLAGATVQFAGAADSVVGRMYSARSDSAGRYAIANIAPGSYVAGFFHPLLDSLGIQVGTRSVAVGSGNSAVPLATPSARTIARTFCPEGTFGDSLGMLVGRVVATRTGTPMGGAEVRAEWTETVIAPTRIYQRDPEIATVADSSGWFGMCLLPGDVALMVRAATSTDSSGFVEITIPPGELRHVTFHVGGVRAVTIFAADTGIGATPTDSTLVWARRGEAQLSGVVTDPRGQPVSNVRVLVWNAARYTTTNDRGGFSLDSLPGGTNTVEVRAIGYTPVKRAVQLDAEQPAQATIALGERAVSMPTITVRGQLVYSRKLLAFEHRRRTSAVGHFITPEDLEGRPFNKLSDIVATVPAVVVSSGGLRGIAMSTSQLAPRLTGAEAPVPMGQPPPANQSPQFGGRAYCQPIFFVDGQRSFMTSTEIDQHFKADEIAAVEIYTRAAQVPVEFQTQLAQCGVIALWTRPPATRIKKK